MIVRKSFLVDDMIYDRLKGIGKKNGLSTGGALRKVVDHFEGRPRFNSPEYKKWIYAVCKVGALHGPAAAQQYIRDYPAPE